MHCPESERAHSIYRSFGDDGAVIVGGQHSVSPAKLQFEVQEFVNGVAGMPVTLYEGSIAALPYSCTVVAASSLNLVGTMRALNLTNLRFRMGGRAPPAKRKPAHTTHWISSPGRRVPP